MKYTKNILDCFNDAHATTIERGLVWYAKVNDWARMVGDAYDVSKEKVAGVFSALSPMMPIDRNVDVYIKRKFSHLMVNFGCTGGQHRSVYCAESLAKHLSEKFNVNVKLRHIEQEKK